MSVLTDILGGGDLIKEIGATVRQVIPNKEAQHDFDLKIAELADKADERDSALLAGQIDVNKIEAANPNIFVSGWRPFIGWMGGGILGYTFIVAPWFHLPIGDNGTITTIVLSILGIAGTMRTVEKFGGVAAASPPPTGTVTNPVTAVKATIGRWIK